MAEKRSSQNSKTDAETTSYLKHLPISPFQEMKGGTAAVFAILAIMSLVVQPGRAVTCGQAVNGMADKRACCSCVKAAANRYADLKNDAARVFPPSAASKWMSLSHAVSTVTRIN
ncbi:hypothetical protein Salat_2636600 [Sesamum alatum]|uniref:Uncharacterized protein n=1 Tax=Sesamum alatum TaxID=300844 RepID=A0AAE2CAQ5_9LAMI|nr:hypothetical protein Salat_2636600 [Sesamum alatum]